MVLSKKTALVALGASFVLALNILHTPAFAKDDLNVGKVQPSVRQTAASEIDQQKLAIAKTLTTWLQDTLQEKKAVVAVIARKGGDDVKKHDVTGMAHAGLAVYDPRAQTWIIYNLLNENTKDATQPVSSLWRTAPLDFFYGQTGYETDALVMIPDAETQNRIYESILNGDYKKMRFTENYNLLSTFDSTLSLNCNKWILMNVTAARIDDYHPVHVLKAVHDGFNPGLIKLNAIEKQFVKGKKNVRAYELPVKGPVETVTIQSFYQSTLFPEKLFYSGKQL